MEAVASDSSAAQEAMEAAGEVGRVERPSGGRGEDEAAVSPARPCRFAFLVLSFLVLLERVEAFGREGDAAFGCPGLGG